ncbi:MAG: UDP-2,3-diacylglucosamine diphosphatase LpxI [Proteobacteria bacterium]|nr:UDP-2,3-diacylglucosamine diphosphatase LpxI [Pseudomonadota bacterium]
MTKEKTSQTPERVGLVAGNGLFPVIFSRAAKSRGLAVFAAAHLGEAPEELAGMVEDTCWVHVGELRKMVDFFHAHGVARAVLAGGITKARLFTDFKPDDLALEVLARLDHTADDAVLRGFVLALEENGIQVLAPTFLVPELLAPAGSWTQRAPDGREEKDLALGLALARKIGALDIGQCVVVCRGTVVAVEAVEGTDATVRRAGALGAAGAVVVKVVKPIQDTRFDLPAIGPDTIRTMAEAGATVLGVEAGKTVVFDRDEMVALADEAGIAIVGMTDS